MKKLSLRGLKDFYINHLLDNLLYFWLKYGIDNKNGRFFTCFNNYGNKLISKNKYVWSQGRFLWELSHLYHFFYDYLNEVIRYKILMSCEKGASFLREHAVLTDLKCAWILNEEGNL